MSTTAGNSNRATLAIAEYMRRVDAGETVDREQFLQANPDVAADLQRYFDNVDLIEQMAGPTPAQQSQSTAAGGARRETVSASQSGDSVPEKGATVVGGSFQREFGRYRIEKTLGEGAMGTVYLARDTQLDRRVALKIPKFKDDDTEMMERFYREARAAAKLRHRHICPVHDIGEIDGIKYISIAYIEGHQLSAYVSPDKPQSERNIAIIVRKLALALQVAHNEGIVHRDLKPANVMVDKKTEPVIMDFGLARQMNTNENERLTQTGTIMGSPAYMSPEQVDADNEKMGPCSDVYSLGVMLYELLTGRLPFEGSIAAVIGQILMKEPDKPSTFRPDLDPRLEEICAKMMAKKIEERYTSMKEVADALTSVLKNKTNSPGKRTNDNLESFAPVDLKDFQQKSAKNRSTKPESATKPGKRRARTKQASGGRQPADASKQQSAFDRIASNPRWTWRVVGTIATLLLMLAITIFVRTPEGTLIIEIDDPTVIVKVDGEQVSFSNERSREDSIAEGPHTLEVVLGTQRLKLNGTTVVRLDGKEQKVRLDIDGVTLSADEFQVERRKRVALKIRLQRLPGPEAPSEPGSGNARTNATLVATLTGHTKGISGIEFTKDGKHLISSSKDGSVRTWDVETGRSLSEFNTNYSSAMALSPDGKLLALTSGKNCRVSIWDLAEQKRLRNLTADDAVKSLTTSVAFAPDGKTVAAVSKDNIARIWDVASGTLRHQFVAKEEDDGYDAAGSGIAYSNDGRYVIARRAALKQSRIYVYDLQAGKVDDGMSFDLKIANDGPFALSPDGKQLAVPTYGKGTHLVDLATGQFQGVALNEEHLGNSVCFSPNGKYLACGGISRVGLHDLTTNEQVAFLELPESSAVAKTLAFSPDGQYLAAGEGVCLGPGCPESEASGYSVCVWRLSSRKANDNSAEEQDLPAGQWVHLLENEQQLKQWQATNVTPELEDGTVKLARGKKTDTSDTGDGRLTRVFDTTAERLMVHFHHKKINGFMAGESVRIGSHNFHLAHFGPEKHELWTTKANGKGSKKKGVHESTEGFKEFADCDYVFLDGKFTAYLNGKEICSDTAPPAPLRSIALDVRVFKDKSKVEAEWKDIAVMRLSDEQVAAIRAGKLPKYLPADEEYKRPDVLVRTDVFNANVYPIRYSYDGKVVLGIHWGNDLRPAVFDVTTKNRLRLMDRGWGPQETGGWPSAFAVSPVATLAAGGNSEGRIMLWDYETGKFRYDLKGHNKLIQEVVFTPDGKQLISTSSDSTLRVWNVESGQQVRILGAEEKITIGNCLAVSPDGQRFVEAGQSRLNFRDFKTGNILWNEALKKRSSYFEAAFSSDGTRLATYCDGDSTQLQVLDTADGRVISTMSDLPAGLKPADDLRFFAGDRLLISASIGCAFVWYAADGRLLHTIPGVEAADVSPDGQMIVTKGPGTAVRLWQLDDEKLQQALAGPTITADNATYDTLRSGSWQSVFSNADDIPQNDGITFKDGKITLDDRKLRIPGLRARNVAVRARIRKESGPRGFSIHVRSKVNSKKDDGTIVVPNDRFDSDDAFWVHGSKGEAGVNHIQAGQNGRQVLAKSKLDVAGSEFELLVAAIDDRLLYFVDGKLVMETRDASVSEAGEIVLGSYSAKFTMSNVAVRVLDSPSGPITQADGWIDIIPDIDVKRDALASEWTKTGGELQLLSGVRENYLRLPTRLSQSYEIEMSFTRHVVPREHGVALLLPFGDRHARATFSGWNTQHISGLSVVNEVYAGESKSPCRSVAFKIVAGQRHDIRVRVDVKNGQAQFSATADGEPLLTWEGPISQLDHPTPLPDRKALLTCFDNGKTTFHKLRWRDIVDGKPLADDSSKQTESTATKSEATLNRIARLEGTAVSPYAAYALAISRDGSLLLDSLTTDGLLRAREVATGQVVKLPFQSPQNVTAAAYSADGETLLFGTSEGKVYVQSLKAGRRAIELIPAHPVVRKLAFDKSGRVLVFSNGAARRSEGAVQRFIVSTRKESSIVRFPQNLGYNPCLVSFTADGSRVAIVNDKRAILYDLDTAKELPVKFQPHMKLPSIAYGWATGVTLSPDSTRLMTWGYDMRAHVSDGVTGERILPPLLHLAQVKPPDLPSHLTVSRGLFSPDRRWFVNSYMSGVSGATLPGEIVVRDTATGEEIASEIIPNAPSTGKSKYNESYVTRLVLSDDGRYLAAAGSAMKIHVWRIDQQNQPPAEALARSISVDFRRVPFAETMQEIGKLAGVAIRVDEDGLKSQGYTLTMSQNLRMNNKTVQDVIEAIVKRYRKMSWRLEGNHILITAGESSQAEKDSEYQQLTAGNWTRVLHKQSEFSKVPNARLTATGVLVMGTAVKDSDAHVGIREATGEDYLQASDFALRMKVKRQQGRNFYFLFRQVKSNGYVVSTNGRDTISAIRKIGFAGLERQITGPQPIEVDDTDWVEWMLVARGKTMTVYAGGRKVLTFSDTDFHTGGIAIGADQSRVQFKEVEIQLLQSGTVSSSAIPTNSPPSKEWLAPKVNSDEIKRAIAGLLKNGFFGRPPNIKAMEKFVSAEVKRRKEDGRMSPNAKFEYRFNSVGKIVFESVSDAPPPGARKSGTGSSTKKKK